MLIVQACVSLAGYRDGAVVSVEARLRCDYVQQRWCVPSTGVRHRRRAFSSDARRAGVSRGFAAVWCVLLATMGHVGGRDTVPQSPCCAVLSLFLAVARHLYAPWKCVECFRCVGEHLPFFFLDVVDAGAYVLSCFVAPRIPGVRRVLSVNPLSIACKGL